MPISMDHKKIVIDGGWTQGRIGPRRCRRPAALGTYCELQEQPREWRVEAKKRNAKAMPLPIWRATPDTEATAAGPQQKWPNPTL